MKSVLLNPCGDWKIENGKISLVDGIDKTRQTWMVRAQTFLGEWFLDQNRGLPYIQEIFSKRFDRRRIENIFVDMTLGIDGVKRVDSAQLGIIDPVTRSIDIEVYAVDDNDESMIFRYNGALGALGCSSAGANEFPATLDGLRIWFDAQDLSALSWDGTNLVMQNKGGTGTAVNAGSIGRAVLVGSSPINNRRAVYFDNANPANGQLLNFADTPAIRNADGITMIAVLTPSASSAATSGILGLSGTAGTGLLENQGLVYEFDGLNSRVSAVSNFAPVTDDARDSALSSPCRRVEVIVYAKDYATGDDLMQRTNSVEALTGSFVEYQLDGDGVIGAALDVSGAVADHMTGYVGEVIVYDRKLEAQELEDLLDFLYEKWGISTTAPGVGYGYFNFATSAWGL